MNIQKLNQDIQIRNQFPKTANILTGELQKATEFDIDKTLKLQTSVCKALTFWIEGYNKELIKMSFTDYYKYCIDKNWIRAEDAWLNLEFGFSNGVLKTEMADKFNIKINGIANFDQFINWANTQDFFIGTLRIVSKTGGKHSLICYKYNGKLYISDTSNRGIAELFDKHIARKNFLYFTTMIG
jgi:hypothetical protein